MDWQSLPVGSKPGTSPVYGHVATVLGAASCMDHTSPKVQPGEEGTWGQMVQGFPPHIRTLQTIPVIPLPLSFCSLSGWGLWLEGRSGKRKGKGRRRKKRITSGGPLKMERGEKESGPRGWEVGDICGGSTQLYLKHFHQN